MKWGQGVRWVDALLSTWHMQDVKGVLNLSIRLKNLEVKLIQFLWDLIWYLNLKCRPVSCQVQVWICICLQTDSVVLVQTLPCRMQLVSQTKGDCKVSKWATMPQNRGVTITSSFVANTWNSTTLCPLSISSPPDTLHLPKLVKVGAYHMALFLHFQWLTPASITVLSHAYWN